VTHLVALLLGLIQGLTEFFPISSSGHLVLVRRMLEIEGDFFLFDLACHGGTLLAILSLLWRDLRPNWRALALGTLPLFPLALLPHPHPFLGVTFVLTAGLLFASERWARHGKMRRWHPLAIGSCQALAVLPGLSRLGATVAGARFLGWERSQAARFSFLLAVPAILGGMVLELWRARGSTPLSLGIYGVGFFSAFVVGNVALRLFLSWVERGKLTPFAWYCLGLGGLCWIIQ